ncbi:MAG TPA: ABC transporter permease, partial [Bryobacteraceae bacterium]|nr:ABC transporter permease [Bryobacteraceae bacterium]
LALGIGANTAVFSVTDYVLIRPLPFLSPDRLVRVWEKLPGYRQMELSPVNYRDWRRMNTVFEDLAAVTTQEVNLIGESAPERVKAALVTGNLFSVLGVPPLLGHSIGPADDRDGAPRTVVLSYGVWQRAFGGDTGVLGHKLDLNGTPHVVIGVMPPEFRFPNQAVDLWMPFAFPESAYSDRNNNYLDGIGRLRNGVTLQQARAEMNLIADQLRRQYPKELENTGASVNILRDDEIPDQRRLLLLALAGAALCVLLIACSNLANLLLARALVRQKELAVRTALGAGRERLIRQLVTESMVLALLGGMLGVLLAALALPLLTKLVPSLPASGLPSIDLRVLGFAAILTALTGVGFGIVPALRVGRSDLTGLREGSRSGGGRKAGLRSALILAEVTLSVVLLVSAGLLMRALLRVESVDPGFRSEGVLTLETALPMPKYESTAKRAAFYRRVLSDVQALPGVSDAAYISFLPMVMGGGIWPVDIDGKTLDRSAGHSASLRFITPGFFSTLRIPLHAGRNISDSDAGDQPFTAVVSESFVRRYWPGQNPLGHHFKFAFADRTIVGVVGDIRVRGLERNSEPQVYAPYQQVPDGSLVFYSPKDLVVRASGSPGVLLPAIRRIIHDADPQQPVSDVRTLPEIVQDDTAPRAVQVRIVGAFAALAFLLAGLGIHGLLSFTVSTRSPEIAVRIALGAQPRDILRIVLQDSLLLATAGVILGAALAYVAGRAMQALLAGITPGDSTTFLAAAGLCFLMTLAGSLVPSLRALRVDAISAIRAE